MIAKQPYTLSDKQLVYPKLNILKGIERHHGCFLTKKISCFLNETIPVDFVSEPEPLYLSVNSLAEYIFNARLKNEHGKRKEYLQKFQPYLVKKIADQILSEKKDFGKSQWTGQDFRKYIEKHSFSCFLTKGFLYKVSDSNSRLCGYIGGTLDQVGSKDHFLPFKYLGALHHSDRVIAPHKKVKQKELINQLIAQIKTSFIFLKNLFFSGSLFFYLRSKHSPFQPLPEIRRFCRVMKQKKEFSFYEKFETTEKPRIENLNFSQKSIEKVFKFNKQLQFEYSEGKRNKFEQISIKEEETDAVIKSQYIEQVQLLFNKNNSISFVVIDVFKIFGSVGLINRLTSYGYHLEAVYDEVLSSTKA